MVARQWHVVVCIDDLGMWKSVLVVLRETTILFIYLPGVLDGRWHEVDVGVGGDSALILQVVLKG